MKIWVAWIERKEPYKYEWNEEDLNDPFLPKHHEEIRYKISEHTRIFDNDPKQFIGKIKDPFHISGKFFPSLIKEIEVENIQEILDEEFIKSFNMKEGK